MAAVQSSLSALEVIQLLDLKPHPEGGHFRETFRDSEPAGDRGYSTAIYFFLAAGEHSVWHRVDAAEIWHFYAGAPLLLSVSKDGGTAEHRRLGSDIAANERPQIVVPADYWNKAESLGAWTLVGCTVAPAFEFAGFEMASEDFAPA